MSQKTIILTVVLFALIVIGMFAYAQLRSAELNQRAAVYNIIGLDFLL